MYEITRIVLYCILPLLASVYFYWRKPSKTYSNLPPMLEEHYSRWTGHVMPIISNPNSQPNPWIPNLLKLARSSPTGVAAIYTFGPKWFAEPMYIVKDPVLCAEVLTNVHARRFHRQVEVISEVIGRRALAVIEDREYVRHRKLLTSSVMHKKAVRGFVEIVANTVADFLDQVAKPSDGRRYSNLTLDYARTNNAGMLVVESLAKFSFGMTICGTSRDPEQRKISERFGSYLRVLFGTVNTRVSVAGVAKHVAYLNIPETLRLRRAQQGLVSEFVGPAIRRRKQEMADGVEVPSDALTMMLEGGVKDGEGFTDDEIRDNLIGIVAGSYELTAISLLWILYHLALNPDVQDRCYRDVAEAMANEPEGSLPTLLQIESMTYLHCVVNESLRLHNPGAVARTLEEDVSVGSYTIPKHATVLTVFDGLNEQSYDNFDQFRPERWEADPVSGGAKRPGLTSAPFGFGQYKCFGYPIAMAALRTSAAMWLLRYKLELDDENVETESQMMMVPVELNFRLYPREQS
ncbi:1,25-dihydroxyvitamin D(3) 24-hydroxylase, mitochondrial-like [Sycon ciliatum]|uniref:1,25-dihydroxyvitamin D(3) 24-hydroxylase, mitochondrial-like n=1 Tax=Sycon ciliatum TaxID=27933 RepID=UPI0031F6D30A